MELFFVILIVGLAVFFAWHRLVQIVRGENSCGCSGCKAQSCSGCASDRPGPGRPRAWTGPMDLS